MKDWNKNLEAEGTNMATPMKPQVVGWELGKRTRENAIIVSDSGTNTTVWARYMPAKKGQMHSCSERWRPWPVVCRTRSPRRSRIPSGR